MPVIICIVSRCLPVWAPMCVCRVYRWMYRRVCMTPGVPLQAVTESASWYILQTSFRSRWLKASTFLRASRRHWVCVHVATSASVRRTATASTETRSNHPTTHGPRYVRHHHHHHHHRLLRQQRSVDRCTKRLYATRFYSGYVFTFSRFFVTFPRFFFTFNQRCQIRNMNMQKSNENTLRRCLSNDLYWLSVGFVDRNAIYVIYLLFTRPNCTGRYCWGAY